MTTVVIRRERERDRRCVCDAVQCGMCVHIFKYPLYEHSSFQSCTWTRSAPFGKWTISLSSIYSISFTMRDLSIWENFRFFCYYFFFVCYLYRLTHTHSILLEHMLQLLLHFLFCLLTRSLSPCEVKNLFLCFHIIIAFLVHWPP